MVMYTQHEIAQLRKRLDLSVAEFADRLGVHRTTVYYWESGHSHPRYRELIALNKLAKEAGTEIKA
jgi:DNA-binding transcriptional regulator YiaG